ncbi:replication initiation protein [Roseitranquillus sediminis]|uniref:replication initiation protein n=1 Tax=Roseitranquillus sediminis TaxID=2809051 RepID=UPI001D0C7920|nr:replication initiation protein [Roseitranquillus sediminis]MBM9593991.1 replication initiation protein [Roseitranquillus sediminis]
MADPTAPPPKHTTLRAIATHRENPDAIVEAGEIVDMRFPAGGRMTLRGAKLFHLLVQAAGVRIADQVQHRITLAALNETFHATLPELQRLIEELHTTTLRLQLTDARGRRFTKSGPILSDVEREDEREAQAELRFEFSPALRRAIANSSHWAVISRRAVMAFESKYALRLYAVMSLRAGLRKASEAFALDELRELVGVPAGKLPRWQDFKLRALEPAMAEINQLAGFHAGYVPITRGRRVVGVTLTWGVKDHAARVEAMRELDRPKVGRKARRDGKAELIAAAEDRAREELAQALAEAPRGQDG